MFKNLSNPRDRFYIPFWLDTSVTPSAKPETFAELQEAQREGGLREQASAALTQRNAWPAVSVYEMKQRSK